MSLFPQIISCDCGEVSYQAKSTPIVTAVCYCLDCQSAGDIFDKVENIKPFRESDGGTPYVTLRDTDWTPIKGMEKLEAVKLTPKAPTTRYITSCCQSPIFIKFKPGFWTSTYRARYTNPPALEWRTKTARRQSSLPFPDTLPRFKSFPLRLFWRLLKAKLS